MSSIVKKGTHFAPKIKKKVIRRKNSSVSGGITPPATQVHKPSQDGFTIPGMEKTMSAIEAEDQDVVPQESLKTLLPPQTATPESTQPVVNNENNNKPSFKFSLTNESPKKPELVAEEDIDPMDTSKRLDEDKPSESYQNAEEFSDNSDDEVFKLPEENQMSRRQSSVRRLSGITSTTIRSRSGSVSLKPPSVSEADSQYVPARINIPVAKSTKRRRSSAPIRPSEKRAKIRANIAANPATAADQIEADEADERARAEAREAPTSNVNSEYVVAVDPESKRLRKYRLKSKDEVEQKIEELPKISDQTQHAELVPIAPPILETTIENIRQLPNTVKNEDVGLYAGIEIEVDTMTMRDLCKPSLPIGKTSSNFTSVQLAEVALKKKRDDRRRYRDLARIERKPVEEIEAREEERGKNLNESDKNSNAKVAKSILDGDDEPSQPSGGLQLNLDAEGRISLDTDSTVVSRHLKADNSGLKVEIANEFESPIISSTYSKRRHTDRWTNDEMIQFYQALSTFGTDFSLIAQLFPYRSRKQIKMKFNLEEKKFPEVVEMALKRKLPANFEAYCSSADKKIETLEHYNIQLQQVRIEHEESMAQIAQEKERAIREDAEESRRREIEIRTGSKPMTRAERIKELRKNEMVVGSVDDVKKHQDAETV
ncbi:predicted protein [Scheffersomyces stipitis CBS 6054]|uniref:Myb-like domain-containing protein n=1 Tax=Scheffersomyces stipitis (strain ATCC 58785 / CBS 6054 / NBRC 10063 / NRRL Y-11545) TaxID=322104 RepID=A3M0H6_PICST|nr:predicted protein [Scheffersomyces stipitis CBS 6054]ABN68527.2 predicted protein [Scheffersomyces stipitis CBS 6054]